MESVDPEILEHAEKINDFVGEGEFGEVDQEALESLLDQTPMKNTQEAGEQVLNALFEAAKDEFADEDDKKILDKLLGLVKTHERKLKEPMAVYRDAMFYPNLDNVDVLCNYIRKATERIRICIFMMTNDTLKECILEKLSEGVRVQIVADDE